MYFVTLSFYIDVFTIYLVDIYQENKIHFCYYFYIFESHIVHIGLPFLVQIQQQKTSIVNAKRTGMVTLVK